MNDALAPHRVTVSPEIAAELLLELVRHPTENPPGDVGEAVEWLAAYLEQRGLAVERHPVPEPFVRNLGRHGLTNLIVRHTFGPGPTIALHATLDTLPAGAGWVDDPFAGTIRDGRLIGRGVRDSKGDVAAYAMVFFALLADPPEAGTLELHITADEETGGFLGPAFLLAQGLTQPDAVISAGTSHQVIVGLEGVLHLEVILRGLQAHASRPAAGRDAIAAAVPILAALSGTAATVTRIAGGRGDNLVADRVRFTVDRRLSAQDDGEAVEKALVDTIGAAHKHRSVELECRRILLAEPVQPTPSAERLASVLSRHAGEAFAETVNIVSAPVVTSARHYASAGIPTALYGVGPPIIGEGAPPDQDEAVDLADLSGSITALQAAVRTLLMTPLAEVDAP